MIKTKLVFLFKEQSLKKSFLFLFLIIGRYCFANVESGPLWFDFDTEKGRAKTIVYIPEDYDAEKKYPILISLHGMAASPGLQNTIFDFSSLVTERQFIYVVPSGTKGLAGLRFWDGTDFCCGAYQKKVDDVTYIKHVIDEIDWEYPIDKSQIYFFGHSNGGFLAHRLACEEPFMVAAFVSFSGLMWKDFSKCQGSEQISHLHIHGTKDEFILYDGTSLYPSAEESALYWVNKNNCQRLARTSENTLLSPSNMDKGPLKTVKKRWSNCDNNLEVSFWTVQEGVHLMNLNEPYLSEIIDFLFRFKKDI